MRASAGHFSGSLRAMHRIVDGLAARGHEVARVAADPRPLPDDRNAALAEHSARLRGQRRTLGAMWSERRPDLIYIEYADDFGHLAADLARELRIPVVCRYHHLHRSGAAEHRDTLLAQLRRFHRAATVTIAQTTEVGDWLRGLGVSGVVAIGNGVDSRVFDSNRRDARLRASWRAERDDPVVLWVGRLVREKGLDLLVEAAARISAAVPRARFVVVGDGPERQALGTALPSALFTGSLAGDELAGAYASADLLLFTSPADGVDSWGNVVSEAMASGIATVSFDFGAAKAWVTNGTHGRIAPRDRREDYLGAALELASDLERTRRMGAAARAVAAAHPWSAMVDRYEQVLVDVVERA